MGETLGGDRHKPMASDEANDLYRLLVSAVTDYAIFALDTEGNILTWNAGAERLKGYSEAEAVGSHFSRFYTPEDLSRNHPQKELQLAAQKGKYEEEGWRVRKDGTRFWANVVITALKDEKGRLRGFGKVTRDLTERNLSELARIEEQRQAVILEQVKESERMLDQIFSTAPFFITLFSVPDYRYIRSNPEHQKLHGTRDVVGRLVKDVEPTMVQQGIYKILDEVVRTGEPFVAKEKAISYSATGSTPARTVYLNYVYQPLRQPDGSIYAVAAQGYEVTHEVLARHELEREREKLRALSEGLLTINEAGREISAQLELDKLVQSVTDSATNLIGAEFGAFFYNVVSEKGESYTLYTLSGVPREAFSKFPMPRKTAIFAPTFDGVGVVRSDDITKDPRYGKSDPYFGMPKGHLPVVSYLAVPVVSRSGEVLGGLFFGHSKPNVFSKRDEDVVLGLVAQAAIGIDNARLFQQSKEAIRMRDEFLSIASHELRTPLTAMKIQTQMFHRNVSKNKSDTFEPGNVTLLVGNMDRSLDRLVRLVEDMLDISRIQNGKLLLQPEPVSLPQAIGEIMERLRAELASARIELHLDLNKEISAQVDRFRFEQVLTNLATNVIRYAGGAPVTVALSQVGDRAVLRFQDTGPGIPLADQARIFNRFERLVSANKISGMGLGLYICKEIIEAHGGSIRIESEVGKGSCFVIELPVLGPNQGSAQE